MESESRLERRLDRWVARATTPRGAAIVIACASIAITFGSAILMTIADHKNYPSIGSGLWWAVQTVTTVGYGDHTPVTVSGRLVAALVMLVGIGFLTVITAAITSTFVSRTEGEQTPRTLTAPRRSSSVRSTPGWRGSKPHSAVPRKRLGSVEGVDRESDRESERRHDPDQLAAVLERLRHHRVGEHCEDRAGCEGEHEGDGVR